MNILNFIDILQSTPWRDIQEVPIETDKPWERKEVIAPVSETAPAPWRRPDVIPQQDNRRKSAPVKSHWQNEGSHNY